MNPLVLLCVVMTILVPAFSQELQLTSSTYNVVNGSTEAVTLTCKASQLDFGMQVPILLQLEKVEGDVVKTIASQRSATTLDLVEANGTTVSGSLGGKDGVFVEVEVASPQLENTGVFQCRLVFFDIAAFKVVVMNKTAEITFTEPDEPTPEPPVVGSCSCDQVWVEVKDLRETLVAENRALKEQLKSYEDACRVSFTAHLSKRVNVRDYLPLVFDDVVVNRGGAYNGSSGTFLAPCTGNYFFRVAVHTEMIKDVGYIDVAIEVDGKQKARATVFSTFSSHHEQSSNGAVVALEEGQTAMVRVHTTASGRFYAKAFSIFTGFFVSP